MKYIILFLFFSFCIISYSQDKFKTLKEKHNFSPVLKNTVLFPGMEKSSTPEYIGGKAGLDNFVKSNLTVKSKTKGTVTLMYMINTKGQITNIQITSGTPEDLNKPLIEALKKSGPWIPGNKNG